MTKSKDILEINSFSQSSVLHSLLQHIQNSSQSLTDVTKCAERGYRTEAQIVRGLRIISLSSKKISQKSLFNAIPKVFIDKYRL